MKPDGNRFGRLTHLLVGNFKAFKQTQRIPIRPITLIYGKNNSGKSSIIQSLLYAESVRRNGDLNPISIEKNGVMVMDGGYDRLVHGRDSERHIELGWEWENPDSVVGLKKGRILHRIKRGDLTLDATLNEEEYISLADPSDAWLKPAPNRTQRDFQAALATLQKWLAHEFRLRVADPESGSPELRGILESMIGDLEAGSFGNCIAGELLDETKGLQMEEWNIPPRFRYCTQIEDDLAIRGPMITGFKMVRLALGVEAIDGSYREKSDEPDVVLGRGLKDDLESHVRSFIEERGAYLLYHWFQDVWEHFTDPLKQLVGISHYLPSVRSRPDTIVLREPQELYPRRGHLSQSLAREHRDWICQKETLVQANLWLRKHRELVGNVELRRHKIPYADGRAAVRLSVYDRSRRVSLDLKEVGFGISQFLPVLLASFAKQDYASDDGAGTLIVEEPEAHIHPALQSEIGDLFIEAVSRKKRPLSYVICETHSEHLLLRIMRRIGEGKLSPSMVSVLYVENLGKESIVRSMPINERGEMIRDWPGGFFEEGLREVLT